TKDGAIGAVVAKQDESADAANDALVGNDIARGEAEFAKFFDGSSVVAIALGHHSFRSDLRNVITRAGLSGILLLPGNPEEIQAGGAWFIGVSFETLETEHVGAWLQGEVWIDKTRID